jgi:hypothetical protein
MALVVIEAEMSIRIGSPSVGIPGAAEGRHAGGVGVRGGQQDDAAPVRRPLQEGGQAGDVVAPADGDRGQAPRRRALDR